MSEKVLFQEFLLPFSSRLAGQSRFSHYKTLRRHENMSQHEIRNMQLRKLKGLLAHAFEHVPYYRQRFNQWGVHPKDIKNLEDYAQIPVLQREDIRHNLETMVADNVPANQLALNATGGSTGTPLHFYEDRQYKEIMRACWMRGNAWVGWQPGMRNVWLWGATQDFDAIENIRSKVKGWLNRRIVLCANRISEDVLYDWVQRIDQFRPRFIYSYGSALSALAEYVSAQHLTLPSVEAAIVTADALGDREHVERVFGFKVYNQYGSREVLHIASECKNRHMHIDSDVVLVEFLPVEGSTTLHRIIVTPLHAYGMPLLRYDLGDVGAPECKQCSCGLPFPLMSFHVGRVSDCLSTTSGALVPSGVPATRLGHVFGNIAQFQIIQREISQLDAYIIKMDDFTDNDAKRLVFELKEIFGQDIHVQVNYVDAFPDLQSGKHRPFISELQEDSNANSAS